MHFCWLDLIAIVRLPFQWSDILFTFSLVDIEVQQSFVFFSKPQEHLFAFD